MLLRRSTLATLIALAAGLLVACGGSGSGQSALEGVANPTVAAQIEDIRPSEVDESVAVFIEIDDTEVVSAANLVAAQDRQRALQEKFLNEFSAALERPVSAASTASACSGPALRERLAQAKRPASGTAVRIELTRCELDLLPKLKMVRGVHVDLPLTTQAAADAAALHQAIVRSFDGSAAWPALGGTTLSGANRVIAVLDTGVEERHPALGSTRVLQGACFSTPSNNGKSLCPNGASVDTTSLTAGRSCIDSLANRSAAIGAGCGHGTGMAAVAAMDYGSVAEGRAGVAKAAAVLPVQVFNADARGNLSATSGDLLAALEWVAEQANARRKRGEPPIAAVNMSLGGGAFAAACDSDYLGGLFKNAFARLRSEGVIPVVAAGNSGNRAAISFPACVSNALPVAAAKLDYSDLASYSNFSDQVRLVAIGGDRDGAYRLPTLCAGTGLFDCWATAMGTSPATALVSGAVASLHALQPSTNLAAIESALTADTTTHIVQARPALRLTAAAERLTGLAAVNPVVSPAPAPSPSPSPPPAPAPKLTPEPTEGADIDSRPVTRVCVHFRPDFEGRSECRIVRLQPGDAPLTFPHMGVARSVSIRDALTGQAVAGRVKVTLFTTQLFFVNSKQFVITQDNRQIDDLAVNYLVRRVQIEPLP